MQKRLVSGWAPRAGLSLLTLGLCLAVAAGPDDAAADRSRRLFWPRATVGLCAGQCSCSYCDRIVNGQCYVGGRRGYRNCTTACGAARCRFRPGQDGCGPILYLGCSDADCRGAAPPPVPAPPPQRPGVALPPPVPPVGSDCAAQEWVELQAPRIGAVAHQPPHPVLQAQTAPAMDARVNFFLTVRGGRALLKGRQRDRRCRGRGDYPDDCPDDYVTQCRTFVKAAYDDPVAQVQLDAQLTAQSRRWIQDALRARYPRAGVRQAAYSLPAWTGRAMAPEVSFLAWRPRDPGRYQVVATATTHGTPVSAPQTAQARHAVTVSLRDTTLVP